MKLIAGTNNEHKIKELIYLLDGKFDIYPANSVSKDFDPIEDGVTFTENALIKAREAFKLTNLPSIADDSGLCIDALNGEPGINSARYAPAGTRKSTVLSKLNGVVNRSAHFTCVFAYVDANIEFTVEGNCHGRILTKICGEGGFGYDSIFYSNELGKSFAEATDAEKNQVSHRAIAANLFLKECIKRNIV